MLNKTACRLALALGAMLAVGGASAGGLPDSMAVLGDSISRATLADNSIGGVDYGQPRHSWATGDDSGDIVISHYERILAQNAGIKGHNWNLARSGAKADDLPGQANTAVSAGADYVVVLAGANDVCADKASHMTPTSTFLAYYEDALSTLRSGLPDATIVVAEIPRVRRIYDVARRDFWCQLKWAAFQWCDDVLRRGGTERNLADARNIDYNNGLRTLAAEYGVFFDDNVFEWAFEKGNLSEVDCFHPDLSGQRNLAHITYDANRF
jgi:lysophospholipase L1-like esterase